MANEVEIVVKATKADLDAKIAQAKQQIADLEARKASPKLDLDAALLDAKIAQETAKLDELANKRPSPEVNLQIEAAQAKLALMEAKLDELNAKRSSPKVDLDIASAEAKLALLEAEANKTGESISQKFKNLDLGQAKWAALSAVIMPAIGAIGQLSGALGLIPAVAAGAGTSLATVALGVQGMKTAFEGASKVTDANTAAARADAIAQQAHGAAMQAVATHASDAKQKVSDAASAASQAKTAHEAAAKAADEHAAAMKNLAPAAQQVVSAVLQLEPAFTSLRLDVQQHLFQGLGQTIKDTANTALPVLRTGLDAMAIALNGIVKQVAEFIQQKSSVQAWQQIYTNLAAAAVQFQGAIKPILQIITDITQVGAQFLPGMAKNFADAATAAADFVSKAKETGQLKQWIQTGIDAVKQLWQSLKDVIAIIGDLSNATLFGGSFLDALNAVTGGIRWLLENVPGLTTIVQAFIEAWVIAKIVQGLTSMITTIGGVVTAITGTITKTYEWAAASEAASARSVIAWKAAGLVIAGIAAAVAADQILPQNEPGANDPLSKMRDELHQIAAATNDPKAAIADLGNEFTHFNQQFDFANSPVKRFWDWFTTTSKNAFALATSEGNSFSSSFSGIWDGIKSAASSAWSAISSAGSAAASAIRSAWSAVSGFFSGLWNGISSTAQNVWNSIVSFITGIPAKIQAAWNAITGFFSNLWNGIVSTAQAAWNGLVSFISGLVSGIESAWNAITGFFSGLWNSIVSTAQSVWQSIVTTVTGVVAQIEGAFQALPGQLAQIGTAIVQGIGNAIKAGWAWLQQTVASLAQQLFQAAKAALGIASPSKHFHWIGQMITQGLADGIQHGAGGVFDAINDLLAGLLGWHGGGRGGGSGGGGVTPAYTTSGTSVMRDVAQSFTLGAAGTASYISHMAIPTQRTTANTTTGGGGASGGGGHHHWHVSTGNAAFDSFLAEVLRRFVRVYGGGNVQTALGTG